MGKYLADNKVGITPEAKKTEWVSTLEKSDEVRRMRLGFESFRRTRAFSGAQKARAR